MTGRPIETGSHAVVRRLGELENHSPSFTLYVDHRTSRYAAYQIGSRSRPFKTIQQALDTVQPAIDGDTSRVFWTIFIAGGTYDEDLVFDITNKRVRLQATGPVNLGIMDANTWQPDGVDPRRNITLTGDSDVHYANMRPYFGIAAATDHGARSGAVSSSFTAFRISGKISVQSSQTSEYSGVLEGDIEAEVFGSTGSSDGVSLEVPGSAKVYWNFTRCTFRGTVNMGLLGRAVQSIDCEFRATVHLKGFTRMVRCHLDDGLYTHANDNNNTTSVKGLLQSTFKGEFDGGDASPVLLLDRYTLQNFTLNSATLGAGATTSLMDA